MSTQEPSPYAAAPVQKPLAADQRPSGLTAVGVLCMVGGMVGLFSGLFTLLNVFFGAALGAAFIAPGEAGDAQREMQASIQAVGERYFIGNLITSVGTTILGACLLTGGIGVFRTPAWGRTLIRRALILAILLECMKVAIYVMSQVEMMPIMEEYMQKLMTKPGGAAPPPAVGSMMKVFTFIGLGIWLVWAMLKLGLYVWGRVYLKKPTVLSYFGVVPEEQD